jgi:ribosomal protein S18 acetylase RimI-like enzyme
MADEGEVLIRTFDPDRDTGFIVSTWPKAIYFGSIDEPGKPWADWAVTAHEKVKDRLTKCEVRIASLPEAPELIVGYAAVWPGEHKLEFVYVKKVYRHLGIGRMLCRGLSKFQPKNVTRVGLAFAKALELKAVG